MGDGDYAVLAYYPYDETVSGNVADGTLKGCLPATQNMYVRGEGKNDSYDASADWLTATSALSAEGGVAVGEPLVFKRLFAPDEADSDGSPAVCWVKVKKYCRYPLCPPNR